MKVAAHLALFLVAVLAGAAAGTPALVERAGRRVEAALERALDAEIEVAAAGWSASGEVRLLGVRVTPRGSAAGEAPLLVAEEVTAEIETLFGRGKVRLTEVHVRGARVTAVRRSDGTDNVRGVAEGAIRLLRGDSGGGDGGGGGLSRRLDRHLPELSFEGLDVDLEAAGSVPLPAAIAGAGLPGRLSLRRGTVRAANPALLREEDRLEVSLRFEDTSLDPGHGVEVDAAWPLGGSGGAEAPKVEVRFDRPARVWLGERALAFGALRFQGRRLEVDDLALSVVLGGRTARDEPVDPAATVRRIALTGDPAAALAAAKGLARGRDRAEAVTALAAALEHVEVDRPILVFERRPEGHNFVDLVPPGAFAPGPEDLAGPDRALGPVMEATRLAIRRATAGEPDASGKGFRGFLVRGFTRLADDVDRISRGATALARVFPLRRITVREAELAWRDALSAHEAGVSVAGRLENFDLEAKRSGDVLEFTAAFLAPGTDRKRNVVDGRVHLGGADLQLHASIDRLRLFPYRQVFPASLPVREETALVGTDVTLLWSPATRVARVEGSVEVEDGVFHYRPLAVDPLTGIDLRLEFESQLDTARSTFVLGASRLRVGEVRAEVRGDVARYDSEPKLSGALKLDRTRCQDLVDALPQGLLPMLEGLQVAGTLAWQLDFSLDTNDMDSLVYRSSPELHQFRVVDMGRRLHLDAVRGTFLHRIQEADGTIREMLVGPGSPDWVSLAEVSPYMVKAVTTTEDGSFFRHSGFSPFAIRESLVTNLKKGGFYRGASTISQQLTKNLFLSREKTISRKLQELFITWQLENALDKERIMELYLNVIEFGPGLYGLRRAADVYFGKHPSELSALESVFITSLIPNPRRFYHQYDRGEVTDGWRRHLRWIMQVMVERGKITEDEFLAASPWSPSFRPRDAAVDLPYEPPPEGGKLGYDDPGAGDEDDPIGFDGVLEGDLGGDLGGGDDDVPTGVDLHQFP